MSRRIRVTGRVQGVFYRSWTREQARQLGVTGWVRNCPDGSVEAQLEGDEGAVRQLLDRMRRGPPGARVGDLQSEEAQAEGATAFEVRH